MGVTMVACEILNTSVNFFLLRLCSILSILLQGISGLGISFK